jgi:hypothetical protein
MFFGDALLKTLATRPEALINAISRYYWWQNRGITMKKVGVRFLNGWQGVFFA